MSDDGLIHGDLQGKRKKDRSKNLSFLVVHLGEGAESGKLGFLSSRIIRLPGIFM